MFFTYAARILATLALIYGVLLVGLGITIANNMLGPSADVLARYWPSSSSTGEMIDKGLIAVAYAVAFGTLAEISTSVRKLLQ